MLPLRLRSPAPISECDDPRTGDCRIALASTIGCSTDRHRDPMAKKSATPAAKKAALAKSTTTLKKAMNGKASPAKAAEGDKPVFDYIASLPQPQRAIAERIDALAAKTLPGLQRSVKWGMAYYGVGASAPLGPGWCFCSGAFQGHQKVMFIRGTDLKPEPPVTPVAMGKATRGVEPKSVADLDEKQLAAWMKQAATMPFVSAAKRRRPVSREK